MTTSASTLRPVPVVATSPLQIELAFRLDCPPSQAFDLVTTRLPEWFHAIHAVRWDHSESRQGRERLGACSRRTCDFGGKSLVEEIVDVVPGRSYTYRADLAGSTMKMPIKDHLGTFEIATDGTGSRITWRQHFRAAWFMPAAMLRWQLRDKMMKPAVEELFRLCGGSWH